jgi:hypothetical protein
MKTESGLDSWDTLITMHNYGCFHETIGRDEEAINILFETFGIKCSKLGMYSPATLKTALTLGRLYRKTGQSQKAADLADQIRPYLQRA